MSYAAGELRRAVKVKTTEAPEGSVGAQAELIAARLLRWMDHNAILRGNRGNGCEIRPVSGAFGCFVEG
jgi:hypothetical protein